MLGDDLEDLRSGDLRKAIRRGDKFVDKVIEDAAEYIGIGVANLVNILNPEVVVLGGGVIEALGDEMMSVIVETAQDYAMPGTMKGVRDRRLQAGRQRRHHRRRRPGQADDQVAAFTDTRSSAGSR